jgi:hypothetical protein
MFGMENMEDHAREMADFTCHGSIVTYSMVGGTEMVRIVI